MVHSILRAPKLIDIYQRKVKTSMSDQQIAQLNQNAFDILKSTQLDDYKKAEKDIQLILSSVRSCLSNEAPKDR